MKLFKLIISVLFYIFLGQSAYACMCGNTSVRDAYMSANTIIIAVAEKIEYPNIELPDETILENIEEQKVTLKSIKSFKGNKNTKIILTQSNSTCDWWFDEEDLNKELLLYLYKREDGTYSIVPCGRSISRKSANDDLSWLFNLPNSLKRNRISGTVKHSVTQNNYDYEYPLLENIKIKIEGKDKIYNFITDKNGFYEIWDLPEGKYKVSAEIPVEYVLSWTKNMTANWTYFWQFDERDEKSLEVELEKYSTGGIDFMFERKRDEK